MQVILLTDVPKIGRKNEVKNVSDGYANNFLLPRKLAQRATAGSLAKVKESAVAQAQTRELEMSLLQKNLADLKGKHVHISARVSEKGHLYEGLRAPEILKALQEQHHIDLPQDALVLEHPLKEVGEHQIAVEAHGHKGSLKVIVEAAV